MTLHVHFEYHSVFCFNNKKCELFSVKQIELNLEDPKVKETEIGYITMTCTLLPGYQEVCVAFAS